MKKNILLITCCLIIASCSKETNENTIDDSQNLETIKYTYEGKTYTLNFKPNEQKPVDSESAKKIKEIYILNKNIITHIVNENEYLLFRNDDDLENYLSENEIPINTKKLNKSAIINLYSTDNLQLYVDAYFNREFTFGYSDPSYSGSNCYRTDVSNLERLKDFTNDSNWSRINSGVLSCYLHIQSNYNDTNPDNCLSGMKVRNVFARFYEHPNYKGKSISLDGRQSEKSHKRLKSIRSGWWGGKPWHNRISSIKLSL